jgi:multisubunit Na+/H+ antiporter MnhB subunit
MIGIFDLCVVVLILGLATWTIIAREAFAAVFGFLAYGLLLTLAWVQLKGIDVALTEAAIGGGLTGVLLLGAAAKLRSVDARNQAGEGGAATRWLAAALSTGVALALAAGVLALPEPAPTLAPEVVARMAVTEVGNPITAVLLGFRAMDTLLEAIVLLFALIGVWSMAPDGSWGGRPGLPQSADPDGILAYMARVLPPVGIVAGTYIFWVGADHPGGKFQGATIMAAMWLLVMMAGLADAPPVSRRWLRVLLVAGPLAFIAVGLVGAATAGAFLAYPPGFAKALILVIEFALMPTLTLILGLMLLGPPERGPPPGGKAQ